MNQGYNEKLENLYERLHTSRNGLSEEEALKRLEEFGENKLKEREKESVIIKFLSQFNDFMVILLIGAAIFSALVSYIEKESYFDSIVILFIVVINAILSFIQERKADVAVEALNKMFVTNTYVIRDGHKKQIDVRNVVPGDIIELEAGDYISADARIIESDALIVNESTLTGESIGIEKDEGEIDTDKELWERTNMVYAGCNVSNGHAFVVVTNTGMNTELGKIANSLITNNKEITPLQKKVDQISRVLTYIVLIIIVIMIIIGLLMKNDFFDILMLSISLAVAAIPEGMSSVITIVLSLGMTAMAKRNVIIRKMDSVETLGSTDIICSDKTGTITLNKMTVKEIYVNNGLYDEKDDIINSDILYMCADACQNVVKDNQKYIGDETEVAIYKYLEKKDKLKDYKRIKEFPFDSDRKMMSTENIVNNQKFIFTKGGLESVIKNCSYYLVNNKKIKMDDSYRKHIIEIEKKESQKSLRILAFAFKDYELDRPEENMTFLGLIGMMDPPRETVYKAIATCKNAGIKPIMITGDSINTATAIAKTIGIIDDDRKAIEGKYVDKMNEEELREAVNKYQVYARISPNTKLRIVEALQKEKKVVAMTGDGVNDAPAIKQADIGIGMGITGTEVVKNVADCILVDDSFSTIVDGVEEGRRITSNIKKVIMYLLAGNIVEVILVFISLIINMEMFTTLQLLWINLVTDSIPAIMLAFEKADPDIMNNDLSNRSNASFFTPFLIARISVASVFKTIVMMTLFIFYSKTLNVNAAGSLLFLFLIAHELLFALSCRNLKHSVLNKNIFENKKLSLGLLTIALIQIIIFSTKLRDYFIVSGIGIKYIIINFIVCIMVFIIGEIGKPFYNKMFKDYLEEEK